MNDYHHTETVEAPAARLFDYLADVRNLPSYFSAMTSARPAEGDAVHVVAKVGDNTEESEAWFHADTDRQHLSWGSEGANDYHGDLDVAGNDSICTVTLTLHTEHGDKSEIEAGIKTSLASIKSLVESGEAPTST